MYNQFDLNEYTKHDDYIIEEMLSAKKLFRKQKVISYRLSVLGGLVLAIRKNKRTGGLYIR